MIAALLSLLNRLTTARANKLDNLDDTISSRASASTALSKNIWTDDKASKLDVAVSTRAPANTALSNSIWTDTRAVKLDKLDASISDCIAEINAINVDLSAVAPASTALSTNTWTTIRANRLDNLDVTVTSRAPANTALSNSVWTNTRANNLDNLDHTITSRAPANTALSNTVWTNVRANNLDNLDHTITSRAPASTALSNSVWTNVRANKLDNLDYLDYPVSTCNAKLDNISYSINSLGLFSGDQFWSYPNRTLTSVNNIKSVQRGQFVGYGTITIDPVNLNKAVLICSIQDGEAYYQEASYSRVSSLLYSIKSGAMLTSPSTIGISYHAVVLTINGIPTELGVGDPETSFNQRTYWQVIEYY